MEYIQYVVANIEKLSANEKAHVPDKIHELSKQFITGRPKYCLVNTVKRMFSRIYAVFVERIDYSNEVVNWLQLLELQTNFLKNFR